MSSSSPDPAQTGRLLGQIAAEAAGVILPFWRNVCEVSTKRDGSVVSEADHAAEAVILRRLAELLPDIPVLSEERFEAGDSPTAVGARFLLVDPLDGTRAFTEQRDSFSVNLALVEDGLPVAGAIAAPARGLVWFTDGSGVLRHALDGSGEQAVHPSALADGGKALVSRRLNDEQARALSARFGCDRWEGVDSALKFGLMVQGDGDVYPRLGPTMEWDTAAGHALLLAVGGGISDLFGRPMQYARLDRGLLNPGFVAWAARRPADTAFDAPDEE